MIAQDTLFYNKLKIECGTQTLDLTTPAVMAVLNVTPDSFYDGGRFTTVKTILKQAEKLLIDGADIIDVGGYSTRPRAKTVSEAEELKRIIPAIQSIRKEFSKAIISVDTFRSNIAEQAVIKGADIVNDISGGTMDKGMFKTVAKLKVPYILMHIKGTPKSMQNSPAYKNVVTEVKKYFSKKIEELEKLGANEIIVDPGFGFGKTLEHNYKILKNLSSFQTFKYPLLVGISRKSMINTLLKTKPENALNGTIVASTIALLNGANILRVHDVKETKQMIKIVNYYNGLNQK